MTKSSQLLNIFFARMPQFIIINLFLNAFLSMASYTDVYAPYTLLFFIPFVLFTASRELFKNKLTSSVFLLIVFAISMYIIYTVDTGYNELRHQININMESTALFALDERRSETHLKVILGSAMLLQFVVALVVKDFDMDNKFSLIMSVVFSTLFSLGAYDINPNSFIFYLFAAELILSILCLIIYDYYRRLDFFSRSRPFRNQSISTVRRLNKRGNKILYSFLGGTVLLLAVAVIQPYPNPADFYVEGEKVYEERREQYPDVSQNEVFNILRTDPETPDPEFEFVTPLEPSGKAERKPYRNWTREIVIAFIIITVILALLLFKKPTMKDIPNTTDEELIESDVIRSPKKPKRKKLPSTNMAVRTLYIKKVKTHVKTGLKINLESTAKKISTKISQTEDISLLDSTYHLARYSNIPISKEDIAALKRK